MASLANISNLSTMPTVFIGHGSPMLAIRPEDEITQQWRLLANKIPRPKSIICISAHWLSEGSLITCQPHPELIYDFYGFPQALYQQRYSVSGNPKLANEIQQSIAQIECSYSRGLDHGAWVVIQKMYPEADIPVLQLSLDINLSLEQHFELAQKLAYLREENILILASGNIIHNLSLLDRQTMDKVYGYDWAIRAHQQIMQWLTEEDKAGLLLKHTSKDIHLAIPTLEHYLPLLYTVATKKPTEEFYFFNQTLLAGALDMSSMLTI